MPKKPKYELVRCANFAWRLSRRKGVWYADGRSNPIDSGRHSLGTRDKTEALEALRQLDQTRAFQLGLIDRVPREAITTSKLTLAEGRQLYEEHIGRSRVTGGVATSTRKRYRTVFDKFGSWADNVGCANFQQVDAAVLSRYASHLEKLGYAQKTLHNELTTLKQCVHWLTEAGHLIGHEPIVLKLRKAESQRAYCYRPVEVEAILKRCCEIPELGWLGDAVTGLACTGVRIEELVQMKWSDLDFANGYITLADESGRAVTNEARRTLKSGHSRSFPLHRDLLVVLQQLPRIDAYVFHGPRGGRLKADTVRRVLVRDVLTPLAPQFPGTGGQSFIDGRLHSFRHYFVSVCAMSGVPERVVMEWVGHADSEMVRHYFHLHDEEAKRQMQGLNLLGGAAGCSGGDESKS